MPERFDKPCFGGVPEAHGLQPVGLKDPKVILPGF